MQWPDREDIRGNPLKILDTLVRGGKRARPSIPLRTIFNLIASEKIEDQKIARKYTEVPLRAITTARAVMISYTPGLYAEYTKTWPGHYTFLIDENIPKTMALALWKDFGRATHTDFEKLQGEPDSKVLHWAANNKVDAILTRDRMMANAKNDLTLIAVRQAFNIMALAKKKKRSIDMKDMPLIIQVEADSVQSIETILHENKDFVLKSLSHRKSPYIHIAEHGQWTGPSYGRMRDRQWVQVLHMISSQQGRSKSSRQTRPSASPS